MRQAVVLVALAALIACTPKEKTDLAQDGAPSQSTTIVGNEQPVGGETNTATMNPPIQRETETPAANPPTAQPEQEVHLIEYAIHMPETIRPGHHVFRVENGGKENHAFEIEGNGVHSKTNVLTRGNGSMLEVDLKPGTYTVYCPVDGHKGKGMSKTLTVK
ncbi:MAG TPA: hypothetical protein VGF48_25900 [Thermoanaerobaculia bacterium]|jgi:uncharacterized cupredoxin-like copper-binding protein